MPICGLSCTMTSYRLQLLCAALRLLMRSGQKKIARIAKTANKRKNRRYSTFRRMYDSRKNDVHRED